MAAELTDEQIDALMTATFNGKEGPQVWFQRADVRRIVRAALATQQAAHGAEPVGVVREMWEPATGKTSLVATLDKPVPAGTKLYTYPPPTAEVEKKAARYDFLRHADLDNLAATYWPGRDVPEGDEFDRCIDAAIQSDQAQAGKGE